MSHIEKHLKPKQNNNFLKKFWIIFGCLIVLLIPLKHFERIVNDREAYKSDVIKEIATSWGGAQTIGTPEFLTKDGKTDYFWTLNNYKVKINIDSEIRKKGIFKVPVYTADVELKGEFINEKNKKDIKNGYFITHVTDSKGFVTEPTAQIGNNKNSLRLNSDKYSTDISSATKVPFVVKYKIRGLNDLKVRVRGNNNNINIKGNWAHPSFVGNFLPVKRTVNKEGFEADWSVPEAASLSMGEFSECGVSLLVPVDSYRMSLRAVKYGFLFLALTFLTFFVYEITSKEKKKIHPLQYILIGMAMCIFYLLLVSMSEFIPFGFAYMIASIMTISLIGMYAYNILTKKQNKNFSILITFLLALLYAFLYTLLMLQDLSLILGSIGMFIIIALIMYATRNVEWYQEEKTEE